MPPATRSGLPSLIASHRMCTTSGLLALPSRPRSVTRYRATSVSASQAAVSITLRSIAPPSGVAPRGRIREPSSSSPTTTEAPSASTRRSNASRSASARELRTTRPAPRSSARRASSIVVMPPLACTGTPRSTIRDSSSSFSPESSARSMSTTWSRPTPFRMKPRAAATGSPPKSSTGTGPSRVSLASRPPATSRAGTTSNGIGERPSASRRRERGRVPVRRRGRSARGLDADGIVAEEGPELGQQPGRRVDAQLLSQTKRRHAARPDDAKMHGRAAGMPRKGLLELRDHAGGAHGGGNLDDDGVARRKDDDPQIRFGDVERHELQLPSAEVHTPLHHHDRVDVEERLALRKPRREGHARDPAGQVLEPQHRIRIAGLREPAVHRRDDPADRDDVAVSETG